MKSTTDEMAIMIAPMSPICFAKPSMKPFLGRRLGFGRRVGEHLVERAAQRHGLGRVRDLHDVPADQPLALGAVLVEIVVPEEELRLVDAVVAVVDARRG